MTYYGFISKKQGSYSLVVEFGTITDSPYDHTENISKQYGLTKQQVNEIIKSDTLGTVFIYEGLEIGLLW